MGVKLTTVGAQLSRSTHLADAAEPWLTLCGRRSKAIPPFGRKPEGQCPRCKSEARRLVGGQGDHAAD